MTSKTYLGPSVDKPNELPPPPPKSTMTLPTTKTPEELIEAVYRSNAVIDFVPRKLLIETVGVDMAQRFLPQLPDHVGVNLEDLLITIRLAKPEAYKAISEKVEAEKQIS